MTGSVRCAGAVLAVLAAAVAGGCGGDDEAARRELASHPERSVESKSVYLYSTLPEMARESAYVVRARVVAAGPGPAVGDGPDQLTFRTVTLQVEDVVKGPAAPGDELFFQEEGYESDGTGYVMNGVQWSTIGDDGWYYLRKSDRGELWLASQHGRFNLNGEFPGPSGLDPRGSGPWGAISESDVESAVRQGVTGAG